MNVNEASVASTILRYKSYLPPLYQSLLSDISEEKLKREIQISVTEVGSIDESDTNAVHSLILSELNRVLQKYEYIDELMVERLKQMGVFVMTVNSIFQSHKAHNTRIYSRLLSEYSGSLTKQFLKDITAFFDRHSKRKICQYQLEIISDESLNLEEKLIRLGRYFDSYDVLYEEWPEYTTESETRIDSAWKSNVNRLLNSFESLSELFLLTKNGVVPNGYRGLRETVTENVSEFSIFRDLARYTVPTQDGSERLLDIEIRNSIKHSGRNAFLNRINDGSSDMIILRTHGGVIRCQTEFVIGIISVLRLLCIGFHLMYHMSLLIIATPDEKINSLTTNFQSLYQ
jgi:hypothetical protein